MNANHTKQHKKTIALSYSSSASAKCHSRNLFFLVCAICGLSLTLLSAQVKANDAPQSITIDTNAPNGIDHDEVGRFTRGMDIHAAKYAAQDGGELIFSDKPIVIAEKENAYNPSQLADLGMMINMNNVGTSIGSINKMPAYTLSNNNIQIMPSIPEMVVMPLVTAGVPARTAMQQNTKTHQLAPVHNASADSYTWKIYGTALLALCGLLILSKLRRFNHANRSHRYSGKISVNEMVGKGKIFNFDGNVIKGKVTPINTTFLNVLWRVGKFSKEGSVNTFFYMAFYLPPQHGYATSLKKKMKVKEEESHS